MVDKPPTIWKRNGLTIEMSTLQVAPTTKYNGRRRLWMLLTPFHIIIKSKGLRMQVTVPAGYLTDFASQPFLSSIVFGGRDGDPLHASIIHDWLCSTHVPQWICNSWLRSAMFCTGAPRWKRICYFWAVQVFGPGSLFLRTTTWVASKFHKGDKNENL